MPKLRSKVRRVYAEQYKGEPVKGVCTNEYCDYQFDNGHHVHTMHNGQAVPLVEGDWVFPEPVEGFYYPVKPQAFEVGWEIDPEGSGQQYR